MIGDTFAKSCGVSMEDDLCEDCGRSVIARFGDEAVPIFCDSCLVDFDRLCSAGKVYLTEVDAP